MDNVDSLDIYGVGNILNDEAKEDAIDLLDFATCYDDDWIDRVDVTKFAQELAPNLSSYRCRGRKMLQDDGNHRSSYPKPSISYSALICLALKNSQEGRLTVAEIYDFMCANFPFFRTARAGWKNSVRHNLSLSKNFEKIEVMNDGQGRKSCLWTIRSGQHAKVEAELRKWVEKDTAGITLGMARPEDLDALEKGIHGMPSSCSPLRRTALPSSSHIKRPAEVSLIAPSQKLRPAILDRRPVKRRVDGGEWSWSGGATPPSPSLTLTAAVCPRKRRALPLTPNKTHINLFALIDSPDPLLSDKHELHTRSPSSAPLSPFCLKHSPFKYGNSPAKRSIHFH